MTSSYAAKFLGWLTVGAALTSCTGQLPGSFEYIQQNQTFTSQQKVNTQIDLLWVIDNSSSMDVEQNALRNKFSGFASTYLKPYWDIRIAVITTDTYLANPVFQSYLTSQVPGSANYHSYYISQVVAQHVASGGTTSNDPTLAALAAKGVSITSSTSTAGVFGASGFKYQDLVPAWSHGLGFAQLLPGMHDGPVAGFCVENQPYFIADDNPVTFPLVAGPQCKIRDNGVNVGTASCLTPPSGTTSTTQCLNTTLNDTVHSGYPIISTKPDAGVTDMNAWVQTLTDRFIINASTGSAGSGSERGLGSVIEFLNDNEGTSTAFFRPGSTRGIIFLSDEDDQTQILPPSTAVPVGYNPEANYGCDLNALTAANSNKFGGSVATQNYIENQYKLCCSGGSCALPPTTCARTTPDGYAYNIGLCVDPSKLVPVATIKGQLDTFFTNLDGTTSNPNYFVAALIANSSATVQNLTTTRYQSDDRVDSLQFYNAGALTTQQRVRIPETDRGTRYDQLVQLVGNDSLTADLGAPDYSVVLNQIGTTIVQKKSTFPLSFAPTNQSQMIVTVVHADGTTTVVQDSQYIIQGKNIVITDQAFVLSLQDTDSIAINYQPLNLNRAVPII